MAHPYRVVTLLLTYFPGVDDEYIKLALCHNVIEVSRSSQKFSSLFGADLLRRVKTLTVDRSPRA